MYRILIVAGLALGVSAISTEPCAASGGATSTGEWPYFGGSTHMDRYSPLAQIDRRNVDRLQVLWTRPGLDASLTQQFPDLNPSTYLRGTPIMIDGVLYASDAVGLVEAFDPVTGKTLWVQKPVESTLKEVAGQSIRSVDMWRSGGERRIVSVKGRYLYELDPRTGQAIDNFGDHGRVLLDRHTPKNDPFFGTNGPIVVGDVIVIGGNGVGSVGDSGFNAWASAEDIRGYDARTGKQVWQFHLIKDDPDSWGKGSLEHVGNMAAWAPLSADLELGIVYVPTTSPTMSTYGGERPGNNLYANCLLALDAKTGKLLWYFQTVHHDLWDYDNASAPVLGDITVDGKRIHAVMQANKSGYLYVFDRRTGKPVWPIVERAVPTAPALPGEQPWPTQPIPTKPPAFDRQGISEDDLIDFTPALHAEALKFMQAYVTGPVFTPPTQLDDPATGKKGTLGLPGIWGAGNWNTGTFDPETGIYYAVSMTSLWNFGLRSPETADEKGDGKLPYGLAIKFGEQPAYGPGPEGLPLVKPPYGRVTALDLNKGTKLWTIANGDGPRNNPALQSLNLPPLGSIGRSVALVTKTLLFLGETSDSISGHYGIGGSAQFFAYDKTTGQRVWQTTLPAGATGGPITYEIHGKQYIVVPIGGKDYGTAWVALGLKP
jgi:glucose dehydrogenase